MTDRKFKVQVSSNNHNDVVSVTLDKADFDWLQAEIERLQAFVDAFDEMDQYQPYDGYYLGVIEKVWAARLALEDNDE